jgi:large subunit ribosomal protein L25
VVSSGLVSLRRRGEGEVREQERRLGQEEAVETEGDAQAQGEVLLAPEHNSLDAQVDWTMPVEWTGTVRERNVAGADVGNRLYAGKKRMFKGHKWERMRERRVGRTEMLLRDMDKRIERFKGVR